MYVSSTEDIFKSLWYLQKILFDVNIYSVWGIYVLLH